ncbi:MAG: hypothetical protein IPI33_16975 [Dehalococcoidia bacterium]|jgi:hypothetical protein|uniref:hypothetical protein n=1 Tax=Candidatus Amarobacter glycogenicus TaxID=3140699 RepID=UPI001DA944FC|nr:hypothetical protein [Dehalococcoidia bacterium]MBK7726840.1 hypothetical protein [Dehalococcoidia bacterium]
MRLVSYRPLFAASALMMALFGAITLAVFSGGETPARAVTRWTVEVNTEGFNPRQCNIVRNDEVEFKNTSNQPIRVFHPEIGGAPAVFDETLAAGATSSALGFNFGGTYVVESGLGHSVTIFNPNTGPGTPGCSKEAPTPSPTPTGTATPTATPKPPMPAKCTWNGCAVAVGLASDGD